MTDNGGRRRAWGRHMADLRTRSYEGAVDRASREGVFLEAFRLTTPIALSVLDKTSTTYLAGQGTTAVSAPRRVPASELLGASLKPMGGLLGSWDLTWPALERAKNKFTGEALPPVQIFAMFPDDFTHPHLALFDLGQPRTWIANWPFQIGTSEDAEGEVNILTAIAEADMHERTFIADINWELLDV